MLRTVMRNRETLDNHGVLQDLILQTTRSEQLKELR
jgi:hypothetical protein